MTDLPTQAPGAPPALEGADPLLKIRQERESGEIREIREQGRLLINVLYQLVRNFQIYEPSNTVFERPLEEFDRIVRDLYGRVGEAQLLLVEGQPYLGDLRIRQDSTNATLIAFLVEWLHGLGLGGWSFSPPPDLGRARSFFFEVARMRPQSDDPVAELRAWVAEHGHDWASPHPPQRFKEEGEEELEDRGATAARAAHVFEHGVQAVRGFFGMLEKAGIGSALAARKAINSIVDMSGEGGQYALAISLLTDLDNPLFTHSMHVANLSVAIGRHLGIPRELLAELGLCGLFHDTGFGELPPDFGWARDADPEVRAENHPLLGFRVQLRQRGYHEGRMLRAVVNLEHHLEIFHRGQDAWDDPRVAIHPFSRIVAVADAYDTLCSDTSSRRGMLPPEALQEIWKGRGTRFDGVVVQALANIMGRYPFGTLLELDDGSLAVVVDRPRDAGGFARPVVRVASGGQRLADGELCDLGSVAESELAIVGVLDPRDRGVDLVEVLFPGADEEPDQDAVATISVTPQGPPAPAPGPWASAGAPADGAIELEPGPPPATDPAVVTGPPSVDPAVVSGPPTADPELVSTPPAEDPWPALQPETPPAPADPTADLLVGAGADPFASDPNSPWADSPAARRTADPDAPAPAPWLQRGPVAGHEDPFGSSLPPVPSGEQPAAKKKGDPDDGDQGGGPRKPPLG